MHLNFQLSRWKKLQLYFNENSTKFFLTDQISLNLINLLYILIVQMSQAIIENM